MVWHKWFCSWDREEHKYCNTKIILSKDKYRDIRYPQQVTTLSIVYIHSPLPSQIFVPSAFSQDEQGFEKMLDVKLESFLYIPRSIRVYPRGTNEEAKALHFCSKLPKRIELNSFLYKDILESKVPTK